MPEEVPLSDIANITITKANAAEIIHSIGDWLLREYAISTNVGSDINPALFETTARIPVRKIGPLELPPNPTHRNHWIWSSKPSELQIGKQSGYKHFELYEEAARYALEQKQLGKEIVWRSGPIGGKFDTRNSSIDRNYFQKDFLYGLHTAIHEIMHDLVGKYLAYEFKADNLEEAVVEALSFHLLSLAAQKLERGSTTLITNSIEDFMEKAHRIDQLVVNTGKLLVRNNQNPPLQKNALTLFNAEIEKLNGQSTNVSGLFVIHMWPYSSRILVEQWMTENKVEIDRLIKDKKYRVDILTKLSSQWKSIIEGSP